MAIKERTEHEQLLFEEEYCIGAINDLKIDMAYFEQDLIDVREKLKKFVPTDI
ncbi:MAG: hypothetical protein M3O71_14530 [Bacteroidota bacterium]|nr:hypothetical protein [Bacteroidota bacterium]